jgi:hypothetical protein
MRCPKCGYERQPNDSKFAPATECPACGVVYAKSAPGEALTATNPGPAKKTSPVHEASLKRARERVEKRLRQRMESGRQKDERTEKTLQRARRLAAEGVRQRQADWKRRQMEEKKEPDDRTMAEAAIRVKDPTIDFDGFKNGSLTMFGVVRPEMGSDIAEHAPDKQRFGGRNDKSTVSVTDALAKMAPGDTLFSEKQPEKDTPPATQADPPPRAAAKLEGPDPKTIEPPAEPETHDMASQNMMENDGGTLHRDLPELTAHTAQEAHLQPGSSLMRLLPGAAWLVLIVGLTGAVLSWITLNDVHADVEAAITTSNGPVPIALLLGFAYLATGILGFAFFWVSATIGGQLKQIQQELQTRPSCQDGREDFQK